MPKVKVRVKRKIQPRSFSARHLLTLLLMIIGSMLSTEISATAASATSPVPASRLPRYPREASPSLTTLPVEKVKKPMAGAGTESPTRMPAFVAFDQTITNAFLFKLFPGKAVGLDLGMGYCAGLTALYSSIAAEEREYFFKYYRLLAEKVGKNIKRMREINNENDPEFRKLEKLTRADVIRYAGEMPKKFQIMLQFVGNVAKSPLKGDYFVSADSAELMELKKPDGTIVKFKSTSELHTYLWSQKPQEKRYCGLAPAKEYLKSLPDIMEEGVPYLLESKSHVTSLRREKVNGQDVYILFDSNKGETTVTDPTKLYDALAYLRAKNYENDPDLHLALLPVRASDLSPGLAEKLVYTVPKKADLAFPYLLKAAEGGDVRTIREILSIHPALLNRESIIEQGGGISIKLTPLTRAAAFGQLEVVKMLHGEYKAKIDPYFSLGFARQRADNEEVIKYLECSLAGTCPFLDRGVVTVSADGEAYTAPVRA